MQLDYPHLTPPPPKKKKQKLPNRRSPKTGVLRAIEDNSSANFFMMVQVKMVNKNDFSKGDTTSVPLLTILRSVGNL